MRDVVVQIKADHQYLHQLITGLMLLQRAGQIRLSLRLQPDLSVPSPKFVAATVDGTPVGYDTDDGDVADPEVVDRFVQQRAVLFRRGMDPASLARYATADKHRPLGLSYHATLRHPFFARLIVRGNQGMRQRARLLRNAWRDQYRRFEGDRAIPDEPVALFYARLWAPTGEPFERIRVTPEKIAQRTALNQMRVAVVRLLSAELGPAFRGGLAPTRYALENFPDCVAPPAAVNNVAYIRAMRTAAVCVTTRGLYDSNGHKLAEYVAAARCIVTETPRHAIPAFHAGEHYLPFDSAEGCVEMVSGLLADPERIGKIGSANQVYYRDYLRPDQQMRRSLEQLRELGGS
jgi:hypothetical protein